jgi:hypothetical protein
MVGTSRIVEKLIKHSLRKLQECFMKFYSKQTIGWSVPGEGYQAPRTMDP